METSAENQSIQVADILAVLVEAKNKIKQLEETVAEKEDMIKKIYANMESLYVEDWTTTDIDGKKGDFTGNIYWVKGNGAFYYKNGMRFEGEWDFTGEIDSGELFDRNGEVLGKWIDGEQIAK